MRVLMTSAGVDSHAAGAPAMVPASMMSFMASTPLFWSMNFCFSVAYRGKYMAEKGMSRRKQALEPL